MKKLRYEFGCGAYRFGGIVVFDVSTKAHPNVWATASWIDWPRIRTKRWAATRRKNALYVRSGELLLHRFILLANRERVVDHANGDPLDNRRSNIRECTIAENNRASILRRGPREPMPHVVKKRLADGTIKTYTYPTRAKYRRIPVEDV